jgi:D-glycero-D-manno-heptose 1,7-bisphosphate phosphatase
MVFIVTNQPEVARGNLSLANMQAINEMISKHIDIDEIKVCPHDDGDGCYCRKPLPGMILELAKKYSVDLGRSYLIGDRKKDIEAALAAGVKPIQIDRGYSEGVSKGAIAISGSLPSAVRVIKRLEGSKLWRMYYGKKK